MSYSYLRVLPRDAFNEANMLVVFAHYLETMLPRGVTLPYHFCKNVLKNTDSNLLHKICGASQIEMDMDDGSLYIKLPIEDKNGDSISLRRSLNSRETHPLYDIRDYEFVFNDDGSLSKDYQETYPILTETIPDVISEATRHVVTLLKRESDYLVSLGKLYIATEGMDIAFDMQDGPFIFTSNGPIVQTQSAHVTTPSGHIPLFYDTEKSMMMTNDNQPVIHRNGTLHNGFLESLQSSLSYKM